MSISSQSDAAALFAGDSQAAAIMRALDWSKTPLGPIDTWPESLNASVSICLQSRFALLIWWGPQLVMLYNDSYSQVIGSKHPWALGSPGHKVWAEIWDTVGPMLAGVMERGEATWADDLLLFLERYGYAEECYFTFSYSPIRDSSGGVAGVFTPVLETTDRVIGERRLQTLRRLAALGGVKTEKIRQACAAIIGVLTDNPFDVPFAAIYLFGPHADTEPHAAELCAAHSPQDEPVDFPMHIDLHHSDWASCASVISGQICTIDFAESDRKTNDSTVMTLGTLPLAPWGAVPLQAVAVPILRAQESTPIGFLLAGVSVRKKFDPAYHTFYMQIAVETERAIRNAEAMDRERVLRAAAEAERAQIRRLFQNAPAAICILRGPRHCYALANDSYLHLVNRDSDGQLVGKGIVEAFPELKDQSIIEILDEVYDTGIPFFGQEVLVRLSQIPGGEPQDRYFNFVYQATCDPDGHVDGIFVLAVDATESIAARREVEDREEQFRVLANSIPQLAWMANADGGITWYNQRWYDYTGTTFEQMEGWGWQNVQHPDFLSDVTTRWKQALEAGQVFDMVFPLRGADGTFHTFLTRATPLRDKAGRVLRWFGTNTDIEVSQKAEAALRQSEKLAAVGRLASSIAHEINNPLEAITNLVYLARATTVKDDVRNYLASAEQELDRVSQIVSQTLRFYRQQSATTMTDVSELVDSVLALYRGKLSRDGIALRLEARENSTLVCYAGEVRQVVANLIGNALDAMPHGGLLRLRLRPGTDWRTGRPGVSFTIADAGHGMTSETRKHLFEPFYTTKGETGTGLGLWVSKGIIDKHNGSIRVRSKIAASDTPSGGNGTVFTVFLPSA